MKGITIQADKTRMLRFSINAMVEFKRLTGRDLTEAFSEDNVDFEVLRELYFVGLKHEDKDLTVEQAGDIMDILLEQDGAQGLAAPIIEAISLAFGVKQKDIENAQADAAGKNS